MDLSNLQPAEGSIKVRKRIGRGQGSTRGGTSTRGHKGAKSRSGYKSKPGFEGGQMPLYRRLPKFGFKNINRVEYQGINLDVLEKYATEKGINTFTQEVLMEIGLINKNDRIKILGRGELNSKIEVTAHAYTKTAQKAIEEKGGTANTIQN
ncbi:MAG: 50S ribosomal protein L15 [Bacteroidales bacterium]|nr:50S ribosomal protein L15 [Bacteroidales bacterium]